MSEDEVEEMLAGAHDGISSGLLALAGGWPAVVGLASLTTTETPLPADGLELPEQLYEFFADEVYRALEPESRIGLGLLATAPSLDRELAAELLGAERAERVCAEALTWACSRSAKGGSSSTHSPRRSWRSRRARETTGDIADGRREMSRRRTGGGSSGTRPLNSLTDTGRRAISKRSSRMPRPAPERGETGDG